MIGLPDGYSYVYVPVTTTTQSQPTIYHDIFIDKNVNCLRFSFRCDVIVRRYEQTDRDHTRFRNIVSMHSHKLNTNNDFSL